MVLAETTGNEFQDAPWPDRSHRSVRANRNPFTMAAVGGAATRFLSAVGQSQRAGFWPGRLSFLRPGAGRRIAHGAAAGRAHDLAAVVPLRQTPVSRFPAVMLAAFDSRPGVPVPAALVIRLPLTRTPPLELGLC